jgi:integrase
MAHLREKKGNYYVEFYDPGRSPKRKWVTLRTRDKSVARQKLTKLERQYSMEIYDPWDDPVPQKPATVAEAIGQFLDAKRRKGCTDKTISNYKYALEAFQKTLPASRLVKRVEPSAIRDYIHSDGLSRTSSDTYYRQLRTFFRWCQDEGLCKQNPIDGVDRPGAPKTAKEFLTPKALRKLIRTIREDVRENEKWVQEDEVLWLIDVIQFAVQTGLRRGEICDLRWGAVDMDSGFLVVRGTDDFTTKTGDEGRIPLTGDAKRVLRKWEDKRTSANPDEHIFKGVYGGPLNGHYVSKRFRHYRKKAGLPKGLSFHSLRHTTASQLVMQGVPLVTVQEMLRHSSSEVTERYSHLNPERFRQQIDRGLSLMSGGQTTEEKFSLTVVDPDKVRERMGDWEPQFRPSKK